MVDCTTSFCFPPSGAAPSSDAAQRDGPTLCSDLSAVTIGPYGSPAVTPTDDPRSSDEKCVCRPGSLDQDQKRLAEAERLNDEKCLAEAARLGERSVKRQLHAAARYAERKRKRRRNEIELGPCYNGLTHYDTLGGIVVAGTGATNPQQERVWWTLDTDGIDDEFERRFPPGLVQ